MENFFKYLLYPISVILLISSFTLFVGPISVIALPLKWQTRRNITGPFWKLFSEFALRVVCLTRITKEDFREEAVKGKGSPEGLYIANHQSFIDIPLMLTTIQVPPIMKKEVLYIPLLGICGYSSGAIIVDRKDSESRKKVFEQAKERLTSFDKSLQYYPEGTRNKKKDGPKEYFEIKKPLMLLAYNEGIKIYPVSMFGTKKVLNEKTGLVNYGKKIGSIFHAPVDPKDFDDAEGFMKAAWKKVQDGYDQLEEKLN